MVVLEIYDYGINSRLSKGSGCLEHNIRYTNHIPFYNIARMLVLPAQKTQSKGTKVKLAGVMVSEEGGAKAFGEESTMRQ